MKKVALLIICAIAITACATMPRPPAEEPASVTQKGAVWVIYEDTAYIDEFKKK
jgi:hypothetical protein